MSLFRRTTFSLCSTLLTFLLAATSIPAAISPTGARHLTPEPVTVAKSPKVISDQARAFLTGRPEQTVKVWVFFTDKDVFTKADFDARAASVAVSEKVMKRRAKVGLDEKLFVDLPVVQRYVDRIVQTGAALRRESRYLNAASFEVPYDQLDRIAGLPFVAEIRPLATFVHETADATTDESPRESGAPASNSVTALNYGSSYEQLEQINVPAVHLKGYNGEGVTLAMFDTGYRKSHEAFAQHYADGRVLGEWDFVFNDGNTANEALDWSSQWNHGTYIWSTAAGYLDGVCYGPAYKANFLLAKTEDVRSETSVEEDNWVAAVEWADSAGADVITSSLGYSDWYTYADFDGQTATITVAANTAYDLGIVVCTSMGNGGPGAGTLTAPADAFNNLSVGAVTSTGLIASFSSRGPTYDGRTKPEVCARGVNTFCASASSNNSYAGVNGTSLSTPLVAGAATVLLQARPNFTPDMIRLALMETADNAGAPNNNYGWGVINLDAALGWGASFTADVTTGDVPLTVQFTETSTLSPTSWLWSFGDGGSSTDQNPAHEYTDPGAYTVSLTVQTSLGEITNERVAYIAALADTLEFVTDSAFAGGQAIVPVNLTNSQPLETIRVPFSIAGSPLDIRLDSVSRGSRTAYFEGMNYLTFDRTNNLFTIQLTADLGGGAPALPSGSGEILRLYISIDEFDLGGQGNEIDTTTVGTYHTNLNSPAIDYLPVVKTGSVATKNVLRGDFNGDWAYDISDLTGLVNFLFLMGTAPQTIQNGDVQADLAIDISDLTYLVNFLFIDGPAPPTP